MHCQFCLSNLAFHVSRCGWGDGHKVDGCQHLTTTIVGLTPSTTLHGRHGHKKHRHPWGRASCEQYKVTHLLSHSKQHRWSNIWPTVGTWPASWASGLQKPPAGTTDPTLPQSTVRWLINNHKYIHTATSASALLPSEVSKSPAMCLIASIRHASAATTAY